MRLTSPKLPTLPASSVRSLYSVKVSSKGRFRNSERFAKNNTTVGTKVGGITWPQLFPPLPSTWVPASLRQETTIQYAVQLPSRPRDSHIPPQVPWSRRRRRLLRRQRQMWTSTGRTPVGTTHPPICLTGSSGKIDGHFVIGAGIGQRRSL